MDPGEIPELTDLTPEELREEHLMDMSASKPGPDGEEGDAEGGVLENIQTVDRHSEVFLSSYIKYICLSCLPPPSTSATSSASDPQRQQGQLLSLLHMKTRR